MSRILLVLLTVLAPAMGRAMESAPVTSKRAVATLVSDRDGGGEGLHLALRLRLTPGWHTYWRNPGDAGVPADLLMTLPAGASAGPVAWPAPERIVEGELVTYGHTGELLLPIAVQGVRPGARVTVHAQWLVCAQVCVPEEGDFSLDLVGDPAQASPEAPLFALAAAREPRPSPWPATIDADGTLHLAAPGLAAASAWFAPDDPAVTAAATARSGVADGVTLPLRQAPEARGKPVSGVLTLTDAAGQVTALALQASPVAVSPTAAAPTSVPLGRALGFAFLGGLILNLMPCVFPVLAMKAFGLARLAGAGRRRVMVHAGAYTFGVLAAFGALAAGLLLLRSAGQAAGWGFQFQSPVFVVVMAWVLFLVGLNLSGVFAIGGRVAGVGGSLASRHGLAGDFFTGLLAVVVATPCTAPFMGLAIAAALAAPAVSCVAVFLAMGLGLAAPTLALAAIPGFARALPRPGRWMEVLRQGLAFPMYGAAAWLLWVVSLQAGPTGVLAGLAGLVLLGFAAWAFGIGGRVVAGAAVAVLVAGSVVVFPGFGGSPAERTSTAGTEAFSAARLASLREAGRPVFVNMTAAWCVTCLVNEQVALGQDSVRHAFADRGVIYLKGDWTRGDPEVSAFLRAQGRDGVPLYMLFPAGGGAPVMLPQILTPGQLLQALGTS